MARFVRIGNVVLDPTRVKVARIQFGEFPELRIMLRTPEENVQMQAQSDAEASAWLEELGTHTGLRRVQQALLPVSRVRMAQALPARKVKGKYEGPSLRLTLTNEKVTLATDSLAAAEAFLDELLEIMPGGAWVTPEPPLPVPPPPRAEPTPLAPAGAQAAAVEVESGPGLDFQDPAAEVLEDAEETPWDEDRENEDEDLDGEEEDLDAAEETPA